MRRLITALALSVLALHIHAQCSFRNTAIRGSEYISYNLYYNWQFVWVKAGTASMSTVETTYRGKKAFRTSLLTRGNGRLDNFFIMRDTLMGYVTTDMVPLYYRKGAREGKWYTVDEASYSYPNGNCRVKLHRQHNDGTHSRETKTLSHCVYDMVNLFQRARSFDPSNWKKGHEVPIDITDGTKIVKAKLTFSGKETIKADNGKKYSCLKLSYCELSKGKFKEIARFYVTDDDRHVPIRIDMFLRIGSAKAFLTNMRV
jgi:hypothetical protein